MSYATAPYIHGQRRTALADLWRSARAVSEGGGGHKLRGFVLGSSLATVPAGLGHYFAAAMMLAMSRTFGGLPETPLVVPHVSGYLTTTQTQCFTPAVGNAISGAASALAANKRPPGWLMYRPGTASSIVYQYDWPCRWLSVASGRGGKPIPDARTGLDVEIYSIPAAYSGTASDAEINVNLRGHDGPNFNYFGTVIQAAANTSGLALNTSEAPLVKHRVQVPDWSSYNTLAVRVSATSATSHEAAGARFISRNQTHGVTLDWFGGGGYEWASLSSNHADMWPLLAAMGYDFGIFFGLGTNDAFTYSRTAAQTQTNSAAVIAQCRTVLGADFPVVLESGTYRCAASTDSNYSTKLAEYDQHMGKYMELADGDPYILVANTRRLTEEIGFNSTTENYHPTLHTYSAWDSGTTYAAGDLVTHNGRRWRAISGGSTNLNLTPSDQSRAWMEVQAHLADTVHYTERGGVVAADALASLVFGLDPGLSSSGARNPFRPSRIRGGLT